jgi:hypothetical protein
MTLVPLLSELQTHAFLTRNWGDGFGSYRNHHRVGKIYHFLEKHYNMKMWFDEIKLNGDIRRKSLKESRILVV